MTGPFYNLSDAARYCGYKNGNSLYSAMRGYAVPRCGPKGTKFAQSILDEWMTNPESFRYERAASRPRRRPMTVTV